MVAEDSHGRPSSFFTRAMPLGVQRFAIARERQGQMSPQALPYLRRNQRVTEKTGARIPYRTVTNVLRVQRVVVRKNAKRKAEVVLELHPDDLLEEPTQIAKWPLRPEEWW